MIARAFWSAFWSVGCLLVFLATGSVILFLIAACILVPLWVIGVAADIEQWRDRRRRSVP
jgi:hypothetical protein